MTAPTALYRRYRPDSFADVIGQEHVTAPLMAALDKNRVNHAYLFSGPRGCGKTTSARILARCLNCAQGPTSHPCGTCDSCVELARGGPGSLDVIEIDAASHGGVDDARDLRERATFAPIRDRYKIFIIDEAHMVTSAGFNALLKIVEEPPEHIKFIFATTEPDKVIGTIRSRTHHYPFRLVPPEPLLAYLAHLCEQENVAVAPGVLSLVIRAGGGSVRDTLSVLDQLMAGAGAGGLDYELAVDLLGYTHASLLDDVVEALAAADSATVFKSVDKVIQTGHDPRRFVEDLLERFRDLIIVGAMPESAHAILRGVPDELIARMQTQAAQLGAAELSRAADVTNAAFNEMTGATSPRLHLELLGARLLLPGADVSARGMAARLDQMERRLNYGGAPTAPPAPVSQGSTPVPVDTPVPASNAPIGGGLAAVRAQLAKAKEAAGAEVASRHQAASSSQAAAVPATQPPATPSVASTPAAAPSWEAAPAAPEAARTPAPERPMSTAPSWDDLPAAPAAPKAAAEAVKEVPVGLAPAVAAPEVPTATPAPAQNAQAAPANTGGTSGIEVIRRAWPEILGNLGHIRKASWALVNQNVVPSAFDGKTLTVALPTSALIQTLGNGGHAENLRQAIHMTLGITCDLVPITGDGPKPGTGSEPNPKVPAVGRASRTDGQATPLASGATTADTASEPVIPVVAAARSLAPEVPSPDTAVPAQPAPERALPASSMETTESVAPPTTIPDKTASARLAPDRSAPEAEPAPADSAWLPAASTISVPAEAGPSDWDEPAEPWGDPYADSYAPESVPDFAMDPTRDIPQEFPNDTVAALPREPAPEAAPSVETVAPAEPYRPKVSPISAWTTGWDAPAVAAEPVAAAEPSSTPRRSQLLAEQVQQQDTVQDWGVSLGSSARTAVADPGWGAPDAAPDWAQSTPPTDPPAAAETNAPIAPPAPAQPQATVATAPVEETASSVASQGAPAAKISMYQRLANSPEAKAARTPAPVQAADTPYVEDVPSPDDVTIEESGVVGQAAVERILGGVLIEEKPLNSSH